MRRIVAAGLGVVLLAGLLGAASGLIGPAGDPFDPTLLRSRPLQSGDSAGDTSLSITVERSGFPLIRVYADVLDESDGPVAGLAGPDFAVTQDGAPVSFSLLPAAEIGCPAAFCLVFDVSLSMAGEPLASARRAAHRFVDRMGPFDRAAVVSFADCAMVNAPFTDDRAALHAAVDSLVALGLTASFDGVYLGVQLAAAQPGNRAVIAFSDGCDNNSAYCDLPADGWADGYEDDSALVCDLARAAAVSVYTLTFGTLDSVCGDAMEAFARGSGGLHRYASDADAVDSVFAAIQHAVCSRYLITYFSPDSAADHDFHLVEVCATLGGAVCCDTAVYREPAVPTIHLAPTTLQLSDTCQPAAEDITIEALAEDPGGAGLQDVRLFYRQVGAAPEPYRDVAMIAVGGDRYAVVLPAGAWPPDAAGFDYFISAANGDVTVTLPAVDPFQLPFAVSFCPNQPPEISAAAAVCVDSGALLSAVVRDDPDGVARAIAVVFDGGLPSVYDMLPVGGDTFAVALPRVPQNARLLLSVRAWDNLGLSRTTVPLDWHCGLLPEDNWIALVCSGPVFAGRSLRPGDSLRVFDPDGVLSGSAVVGDDSTFGSLRVVGDDPSTPLVDEGAEPGDLLTFTLNAVEVLLTPPVFFRAPGDTIEVCDRVSCRHFALDPGWHLISWNRAFRADIDSLVSLLGGAACVDVVLGFERGGLTYDPNLVEFSTLFEADYHRAYWLRLACPATFDICGGAIAPHDTLPVRRGFNLVPCWPDSSLPVETAWASILEFTDVGLGFDGGSRIWLPDGDSANTLTELAPGFGYWVHADRDGYLVYPGWSSPAGRPLPDEPFGLAAPAVPATQTWMSVYGVGPACDGLPVADGAVIEFHTSGGVLCGRGAIEDGILPFTPVYGASTAAPLYPRPGDTLTVWVDGSPVLPPLVFQGHGSRVPLPALRSSASGPDSPRLPSAYVLRQNYPNPFNPQTVISFDLPLPGRVALTVYNILGRETAVLADQRYPAGTHAVIWDGLDKDGRPVGSGVYLYRLEAGGAVLSRKMLLLR
ncbi:MAG TPA: VWA domain-containing protein [candidate division Zixibacteria bacterium]|nr:VWA domain-containing protein [candidate division Zixibacteria bacterium]MDD4916968.1 VWA domain-containing protein [candidate division Zixibacteria bacterium]MDM7974172.1 VWA domain-containing protein [candidate division Zixibacteria bacterium]HOD67350.1 VWA domain-containing protein [candidate division Zixibacteria bacterium]HPM36325.1 VWA domain-containing protein [candidate division Zixibacteria bacterium]